MFGLSAEHIVVLFIVLLLFGPKRLPELGNTLGKAIKNFKDSMNGVEDARYRKIDEQANKVVEKSQETASVKTETLKTETADKTAEPVEKKS